jgi:LDH2 family malate/lactate/ureidoglycolate dehydrogenase
MSAYPGVEHERRIAPHDLLTQVQQIFQHHGRLSPPHAHRVADSLVAADQRGVHSHGVLRVPEYVAKLQQGVDPQAQPTIVKDNQAALVIDGNNSMGQIAAHYAMAQAIERARQINVAFAAVRGSNHCGAMFYYAMQALPEDMIGIAITNALPTMAPWGSKDKIVGINPLAIAIPAHEQPPIVLDAAFSYSSHGKIRVYHQKGYDIPNTWAFDEQGHPTTDTEQALQGLLQPIGEYKGVGLAIVFGLLSSLLSGAAYGTELGNMIDGPKPGKDGHLLAAIRIAAFEDIALFKQRIDQAIVQIQTSQPIQTGTSLYAPGGLEHRLAATYEREGIPLNDETWKALQSLLLAS